MDFDLSEKQKTLKADVCGFLDKKIVPVANDLERKSPPRALFAYLNQECYSSNLSRPTQQLLSVHTYRI